MKTDKQIYKIFQTAPEFFFELTGISAESKYRMTSEEVKEINQIMDGLLEPDDPSKLHYVVEFQAQPEKKIFPRIIIETAVLSSANPDRTYQGIVIFLDRSVEREFNPWSAICKIKSTGFHIFYLDELLKNLERKDSTHPLVALFAPLFEKSKMDLANKAPKYYNQIKQAKLVHYKHKNLESVFVDWLLIRFAEKTPKEVLDMLAIRGALEDTVAYKELVGIGEKRGKEIGEKIGEKRGEKRGEKKGRLATLKELYEGGVIPDNIFQELYKKSQKQLTELLKKQE